jgi:hypothetical protein
MLIVVIFSYVDVMKRKILLTIIHCFLYHYTNTKILFQQN